MKIKFLIALGLSVEVSGGLGPVSRKEPNPEQLGIAAQGERALPAVEFEGENSKKELASERHVSRMMAWINISTDQP